MKEHPKELRRIYMVSSALFSTVSCFSAWGTPLGAAFGLVVNLTEDAKNDYKKELYKTVETALKLTGENISSKSKQKILEELSQFEVEPDSLSELIKKTESYQTQYCSEKEVREIIDLFETYYKLEAAKSDYLSRLQMISSDAITLDQLKEINKILWKEDKKLDNIQNEVSKTNQMLHEAKSIFIGIINSIAFILVSMAVFLGINVLLFHYYDKDTILIAPICYGISDFLIYFLGREEYIFTSLQEGVQKHNIKITKRLLKIIVTFIIPVFLCVSTFWLILLGTGLSGIALTPTLGLIMGNIISVLLKESRFIGRNN